MLQAPQVGFIAWWRVYSNAYRRLWRATPDVLNSEWKDIERISGLSQTQSPNWLTHMPLPNAPLSVTEGDHSARTWYPERTATGQSAVMKGNIGKPGAGICPLRGHSMYRATEPSVSPRNRLQSFWLSGWALWLHPTSCTWTCCNCHMQAICTGQARALICMGGNFGWQCQIGKRALYR